MKFLLSFLCVLLLGTTGFAQYMSKLDMHASVTFPSKPKEMVQEGQPVLYNMLDKENKVTAMATAIDATQYGVDSGTIAANYNNAMFIDLILRNITGQYSGMRLVSKKKIAVGRLMGYDVELTNDAPSESVPYKNVYAKVFFSGATIYAMTVLSENEKDDVAEREKFFRSLKID